MADECAQGGQDLNGDGRFTPVVAAYERSTGALHVLPVPAATSDRSRCATRWRSLAPEDLSVADLNGDGDQHDAVLRSWKRSTGAVTNHALAVEEGFLGLARDGIVFRVRELFQSADLNSDGDSNDRVLHFFRP